ncbi:MAG TPA: cyclic nucleotide-binding domain-containing protein [Bryobacteraceae bacterium]|nr:cyclic nucleotide-binding domain-containing protein [Bryobacteraceae bacterium]
MTLAPYQTLRDHEFLAGLASSQIEELASLATEVEFAENEVVLTDGQRSASFYLLLAGSVVVELRTQRFVAVVESLGPGQIFGWSSLLDHQDTLFQVRARERTSALRIDGTALRQLCKSEPALGAELLLRTLQVVAGRVKATEIRFAEMCGVRM